MFERGCFANNFAFPNQEKLQKEVSQLNSQLNAKYSFTIILSNSLDVLKFRSSFNYLTSSVLENLVQLAIIQLPDVLILRSVCNYPTSSMLEKIYMCESMKFDVPSSVILN